jgi:hypothetical protein
MVSLNRQRLLSLSEKSLLVLAAVRRDCCSGHASRLRSTLAEIEDLEGLLYLRR